jgi:hypothetical protein
MPPRGGRLAPLVAAAIWVAAAAGVARAQPRKCRAISAPTLAPDNSRGLPRASGAPVSENAPAVARSFPGDVRGDHQVRPGHTTRSIRRRPRSVPRAPAERVPGAAKQRGCRGALGVAARRQDAAPEQAAHPQGQLGCRWAARRLRPALLWCAPLHVVLPRNRPRPSLAIAPRPWMRRPLAALPPQPRQLPCDHVFAWLLPAAPWIDLVRSGDGSQWGPAGGLPASEPPQWCPGEPNNKYVPRLPAP